MTPSTPYKTWSKTMDRQMSLSRVIELLEQQEKTLRYIERFAPLSEPLHKQAVLHRAQCELLQRKIRNYEMRLSGVVRAKN